MQQSARKYAPSLHVKSTRVCLSCGSKLPPRRRRYCAVTCRQNLLSSLNRRAGLLRALNTRYGTFYFTDFIIVMDLLPYDSDQIHSYLLARSPGKKPVEDFCALSNILGNVWWDERNRTKKRYLATRHVLNQASKPTTSVERVVPSELVVPAIRKSNLVSLELDTVDLIPSNLEDRIKQAYRRQAKRHHPDIGGNTQAFIKIQEAYECLLHWAKHPTFTRRRGFPDKWLYEGAYDRWVQPTMPQRGNSFKS